MTQIDLTHSKSEERTEADEDVFAKMFAVTLKRMNPYQKIIARKKINILFEINMSDCKQRQSYPINQHFRGPINTSNNINMTSPDPYSTPQTGYVKTSFPVNPYDSESSTYSGSFDFLDIAFYKRTILHSEQ